MADPRNQVHTNVHGYKKKPSKHREIQGLMTAGNHGLEPHNVNTRSHDITRECGSSSVERSRSSSQRKTCTSSSNEVVNARKIGSEAPKGCSLAGLGDQKSRRSRTLSPARRLDGTLRGRTLSPIRSKPSYLKKISQEISPHHVKQVISSKFRSSKVLPIEDSNTKCHAPFGPEGYCAIHSQVQLAKKDKKGMWRIIQEECPVCKTSTPQSKSLSIRRKTGKVNRAMKQLKAADKADMVTLLSDDTNAMSLTVVDRNNAQVLPSTPTHISASAAKSSLGIQKKFTSNPSPTSTTDSTTSDASHPSPAFSCNYFSGASEFPALPLISDDLNISHADTIKHSNAYVENKKKRSKQRTAKLSG